TLGKQLEAGGLSRLDVRGLRRLKGELDIVLQLRPDDARALTAKGILLIELPRLLGGNRRGGEGLLRRALSVDPTNERARSALAESLDGRGRSVEARVISGEAVAGNLPVTAD
ncbi:MAG TPA: hypothetical protein VEB21_08260, partial [Terriglobales bacterium]|nr:hypothetical protein [Terriglobales bacterium]